MSTPLREARAHLDKAREFVARRRGISDAEITRFATTLDR
jgi:hypothetical protein